MPTDSAFPFSHLRFDENRTYSGRGEFLAIWKSGVEVLGGYKSVARNGLGHLLAIKGELEDGSSRGRRSQSVSAVVCGTPSFLPDLASCESEDDLARAIRSSPCTGHFAAVIPLESGIAFLTDPLGSIPIYVSAGVAGTNLFDVARTAGISSLDEVAVSEFLRHGFVTSPYTIFEGIRRLDPGSVSSLAGAGFSVSSYWRPKEDCHAQIADVAAEAREIMIQNLRQLIRPYPEVKLLFSGGEDSRVLARLLLHDVGLSPQHLTATTFLDYRNREYRLARAAAIALGMRHDVQWREPEHYVRSAAGIRGEIGGVFDAQHFHAWEMFDDEVADVFVDGWTADTYMKAVYFPRIAKKAWMFSGGSRIAVPLDGISPPMGELRYEIQRRRLEKLSQVRHFRQTDAEVYCRMWPISDHPDYGFFASNQAQRQSASPFMFGNFVDVVARLPEAKKVTNQLFWMTFGRTLGVSGFVPRSGGQIPRLPPVVQPPFTLLSRLCLSAGARIRNSLGMPPKAQGPWQDGDTLRASVLVNSTEDNAESIELACKLRQGAGPERMDQLSGSQALRVIQIAQLLRGGAVVR